MTLATRGPGRPERSGVRRSLTRVRPWQEAWRSALYGPEGFYRRPEGPAGHFTTSSHQPLGHVFAQAVVAFARREGATQIVDVGCGRGELLLQVHQLAPDLALTGVDVVPRPADLPEAITWLESPGGELLPDALDDLRQVLVIAHEWLDVIPCTVLEIAADGTPREVLVDPTTGDEDLAQGSPTPADLAWCADHWPLGDLTPGDRVEVGSSRDAMWRDLLDRVRDGTVLAIDYGHRRDDRPRGGTLTGYAHGLPTPPVPDGSCDITAHVAMDSLAAADVRTQREWLLDLGVENDHPDPNLAHTDPLGYIAHLNHRGVVRQLLDASGLGGFLWAVARQPHARRELAAQEAARHTAD